MSELKQRKVRESKYGEETVVVRIPKSMLPVVKELLEKRELINNQWEESQLPLKAQKLVDLLTEVMVMSQKDLIQALKKLTDELNGFKEAVHAMTVTKLLDVLADGVESQNEGK